MLLRIPKVSKKWEGPTPTLQQGPKIDVHTQQEVQLEARIRTLQKRSAAVPSNEELRVTIALLQQHCTPPLDAEDMRINYANFKLVGRSVPERCRQYFQASIFLYFQQDAQKRIKIHSVCQYIIANVILEQAWISVSLYDGNLDERLTEDDMNRYISEFLDTVPSMRDYISAYPLVRNIYVSTIVRRFFFFLDPLSKGSIRIRTLITNPMFKEVNSMRKEMLSEESWFNVDNANRMYKTYLSLDTDGNGKLGPGDLTSYDPPLTDTFINQLLSSRPTSDGELEFRDFLNLELAMSNPGSAPSLRYFFSIFDLDQKGYLSEHDLAFFLKDVLEGLDETIEPEPGEQGSGKVLSGDVMEQIFDLVRPAEPRIITLDDVLKSGAAQIFISILTSRELFDNWESNDGVRVNYQRQQMQRSASPIRVMPDAGCAVAVHI